MRNSRKIGAVVVAALVIAALALPVLAAARADVGDLVRGIAQKKGLNATDARTAVDSLRGAGIGLPADLDLNKQLTQRDVARLSRSVGIRVTTNDPDATFSAEQLGRFLSSFSAELTSGDGEPNPGGGGGPGDNPPFDPFTKAKGKGKGKAKFNRTPTEPE